MANTLWKGLIVTLLTIIVSISAIIVTPLDRSGRAYHWHAWVWSKIVLWLFGIKVSVVGMEHLGAGKHFIYVANHASMFDIPAVMGNIPDEIRIVMKKELTRIPIFGWALKVGHYITIDRDNPKDAMKSLDRAAEKIRNGASVLLFAEGTRTTDGKLQPFKRGAFALAVKSGVPIIPVTINGTYRIMKKGSWQVHPSHITIVLEKPIPTEGLTGKDGEFQLMQRVFETIKKNYVDQ
jgi:1-acyl-sn-glycerol-3-phosphate acyltransferase